MKIAESKHGPWVVLTLTGRIDHAGAEELEPVLLPYMHGGAVALDFAGVDFISSSGFRVLMRAEREQHAHNGRLLFGHLRPAVRSVFDVAGLSRYFQIVPNLAASLQQP